MIFDQGAEDPTDKDGINVVLDGFILIFVGVPIFLTWFFARRTRRRASAADEEK